MCDTSDDNLVAMSADDSTRSDKQTARLSYQDKYDIICKIERGVNRKQLMAEYNLKNYSNLTCIVRNKDKIVAKVTQSTAHQSQQTFRMKSSYYSKVEEALVLWIKQLRQKNVPLPASSILDKAKEYASELGFINFEPTTGYLAGLKRRNPHLFPDKRKENILFNDTAVDNWTEELSKFLSQCRPEDVFSLQEFALYYRLLPLKRREKKFDDRITVVVICNADGSERICSIIGSRKNPRALRGVKDMPIDYYSQTDSLIDSDIYRQILDKLNKHMKKYNRNVLLFVTNRTIHSNITDLSNIKVKFFPQNCELKLQMSRRLLCRGNRCKRLIVIFQTLCQPLDQWFVCCIKRLYRKQLTELLISKLESGSELSSKNISLFDCIAILDKCLQTLPKQFIINCFKKSNFMFQSIQEFDERDHCFDINVDQIWTKLNTQTKVKFKTFDDYVNVDNNEPIESTGEDLSDDQILRKVKQERVDHLSDDAIMPEEEEERDEEMCNTEVHTESISTAEALNAVSVLRRYFDQMSDNSVDQQLIDIQLRVIDNTTNGYL